MKKRKTFFGTSLDDEKRVVRIKVLIFHVSVLTKKSFVKSLVTHRSMSDVEMSTLDKIFK